MRIKPMLRQFWWAAFLMLCPWTCFAADYGGLARFALLLAAVVGLFWLGFCALIFYFLRHVGFWKRSAISVGIFLSPAVVYHLQLAYEKAQGTKGAFEQEEVSVKPVVVAGVTFPAGSSVEYMQNGNFGKDALGAFTNKPVDFGALHVTGLRYDREPGDKNLRVTLSHPQKIEGWLCAPQWVVMSMENGKGRLESCRLEEGVKMDGVIWPAGVFLRRSEKGWGVHWSCRIPENEEGCASAVQAFGKSFIYVMAEYDQNWQLKEWDGALCREEKIASYQFPAVSTLRMLPDRSKQIFGEGKDLKSGQSVACLTLDKQMRNPQVCPPRE